MRNWRLALALTIVSGSLYASGCGSDDAKKSERPGEAGAGGEEAAAGGAGATGDGGMPGAGKTSDAGAPGTNGGTNSGDAGAGGSVGDAGAAGSPVVLTSCDAPTIVDDAADASIAPNTPSIFQASGGGLALLIWREGQYRKGRVLDGDTLGKVFTFPISQNSGEQHPHYVVSGKDGFIYSDWETNPSTLLIYDKATDSWSAAEQHAGLWYDMGQFLANGDTLHVVTDATASSGSLQVRSKAGAWGTAEPVWNLGADKLGIPQLLIDGQDRGAIVGGQQPNTKQLMGWVIRDGAMVAEASVPIGGVLVDLQTAVLPNGDVLAVFQHDGDPYTLTYAATLSYDAVEDSASWSEPVEVLAPSARVLGMAVNGNGDVTLHYGLAASDGVRRQVDGVWGAPTVLPFSDGWFAAPLVDADDTTYLASAAEYKTLDIISAAAGESSWSEPLDVVGDHGFTAPQRPRLGLHSSGKPLVLWYGQNAQNGSDILLSLCQ